MLPGRLSTVPVSRNFFNSLLITCFVQLFKENSSVNLFAVSPSNTNFLSKSCPRHLIPQTHAVTFAVVNFRCHKLISKVNKSNNSDMENFICNQFGERFVILNTENIKICGWITKLQAIEMQFVCVFFHLCRKFDFLISQGSVATCLKWGGYRVDFVANFIRFPAVQKFRTSVNIRESHRQLNGGNFFRDTVYVSDRLVVAGLL